MIFFILSKIKSYHREQHKVASETKTITYLLPKLGKYPIDCEIPFAAISFLQTWEHIGSVTHAELILLLTSNIFYLFRFK